MSTETAATSVAVPIDRGALEGDLTMPTGARGVVLFAHGSGSGRHSPRNRLVAGRLNESGLATLLIDLLTEEEELAERETRHLRFDIELLIDRLRAALEWLGDSRATATLPVGLFGASTGAAAALGVAARHPDAVRAVVSRGGRPDLTPEPLLSEVKAPTFLIVGGDDTPVIEMNRDARRRMKTAVELEIVAGASHLFEEPGALERVADLASAWFVRHLAGDGS
jgi:putative phosphoribosyl transferase